MKDAFDASGRITDEAAKLLPEGMFLRAEGMDGCKNLTLYKRLTLEGLEVACLAVDVEADEVVVEFDAECGAARIITEKLSYVLFSAEMLEVLSHFSGVAAELYADWRDSAVCKALATIEENPDDAKAALLKGAFAKMHAKTIDRWVKVR